MALEGRKKANITWSKEGGGKEMLHGRKEGGKEILHGSKEGRREGDITWKQGRKEGGKEIFLVERCCTPCVFWLCGGRSNPSVRREWRVLEPLNTACRSAVVLLSRR
jgi:hypothetical protein